MIKIYQLIFLNVLLISIITVNASEIGEPYNKNKLSSPRDKFNSMNSSKNKSLVHDQIVQKKIGNNVAVTGFKKNYGHVTDTGINAEAIGVELNIKSTGTVLGTVKLIQSGNVSANGTKSAIATGTKTNIESNTSSSLNINSIVRGNVTAYANANGNIKAEAIGTKVRGAKSTIIKSNTSGNINATAISR